MTENDNNLECGLHHLERQAMGGDKCAGAVLAEVRRLRDFERKGGGVMFTTDETIRIVASMRTDLNAKRVALTGIALTTGSAHLSMELEKADNLLEQTVKQLNIVIAELGGRA